MKNSETPTQNSSYKFESGSYVVTKKYICRILSHQDMHYLIEMIPDYFVLRHIKTRELDNNYVFASTDEKEIQKMYPEYFI